MGHREDEISAAAACPPECALLDAFKADVRVGDFITIADDPTLLIVTEVDDKGVARCMPYRNYKKMKKNYDRNKRHAAKKEQPFYRRYEKRRI